LHIKKGCVSVLTQPHADTVIHPALVCPGRVNPTVFCPAWFRGDGRQFPVPCPAMVATHIAQASQNENL